MKNYTKLIIVLLSVFFLVGTGCENVGKAGEKKYKEVINCLSEDDSEGLKNLFSIESQKNKDLDSQIEAGMDFFDGKLVSYSYINVVDGNSVVNGETVEEHYTATSYEVKTSKDKVYMILVCAYSINDDYPDRIGICEIDIHDEDENICKIGEWIDQWVIC